MALKNEYQEVLRKFGKLPVEKKNKLLRDVTANHMTPELKQDVLNLTSIPNEGLVTDRAILFAIGINL